MSEIISITASMAPVVSFAMHQASVPVITELRLRNSTAELIDGVTVSLSCEPPAIAPRKWTFDRIAAESELVPADMTVHLDGGLLYKLSERMRATVTFRVCKGDVELVTVTREIIALARHEWGGSISTPELLAAFVTPNDPAIAEVLRDASDRLRGAGRPPSLDGYRSQSRERVWEMASAIWASVGSRQLIYAEPPTSFERSGQKVRLPSEVLDGRLATCLDTAVLFAAALEQAGLRPLLCLTKGHAMTALWLQPSTLLSVTTEDASDLRNYIELNELILFETTVITHEPPATFRQALELGKMRIRPDLDQDFVLALDIKQARARQITPLPSEVERIENGQKREIISLAVETPPILPPFVADRSAGDIPDTPKGRLDAWKRRLLDLTKRNRLLNLKPSKTAISLVCTDASKLEDMLADGDKITIKPLESIAGRGGGRDEGHLLAQHNVDFETELARQALDNNQLLARQNETELKAGIVELFRKAKSDMEEGGANTLFLAIGMLRWRESEVSANWHRAPLILVPVKLERATAASAPRLVQHLDETVFNMTLLEMLRQDHDLAMPLLDGDLPKDSSGIDVRQILTIVRTAIRDVPGWEVLDEMVLSTFSFSKYLMWKDLNNHSDELRSAPFVKHMIDSPRASYNRTPEFINARSQDARIDPVNLLAPLSCDSSQIAAIHASGFDGDYVLEGPPGTGKSQTIANLIAHNIGLGRKVLFVAEKMTALNVVHERLKKVGLGDFCLELHSSKANKKNVLAQLDRAWVNRADASAEDWANEAQRLKVVRDQLNGLVAALHTAGDNGISPRAAIVRATSSRFAPAVRLNWQPTLSADLAADAKSLERLRTLSRELGQAFSQITPDDTKAFASLRHVNWSYQWQSEMTAAAGTLITAIDSASAAATRFVEVTHLPRDADSVPAIARLAGFAGSLPLAARMNLQALLAQDGTEVGERLLQATALLSQHQAAVKTLSVPCDATSITRGAVESVKGAWQNANAKMWPLSALARRSVVADAVRRFGAAQHFNLVVDMNPLEDISRLRDEMDRAASVLPMSALWRGLDTDMVQVETLLRSAEVVRAATARLARDPAALPELRQLVRALLVDGRELLQPGMPVAVAAESLVAASARLGSSVEVFLLLMSAGSDGHSEVSQLRALAEAVIELAPRLNAWCRWQEKRGMATAAGLESLAQGLEAGLLHFHEATEAFDVAYARWLAPLLIDQRPELNRFSAVEHMYLLTTFRALDEELSKLAAATIRARASAIIPRKSDSDLIPGFSVLRREVQRKIGQSPVRKLVSELGEALTRLTPCLLMSPHSVAQFLSAGAEKFDLVVFDEASQIAVWDAIGAVARGKNAIIVGDPKQMPPTNFFGRSADPDEVSDAESYSSVVGDLESILDEGLAAGMHHHRLTGHYRSQHESLIAFSNHKYYGGELVTYPASVTRTSAVSFRRCAGAYQKGKGRTNPEEAKSVVAEIVQRLLDPARRHQTIGVVTMNAEQQRLVRNLLDDERRRAPELESAFRDSAGEEVEMVYNLETVQGHERDVIMLSVGYGPTVAGDRTMSMNFGPLNRVGGERRLNVAVTRAIREVVVFASFDPEMIDLTRTTAQAVHDLKAYLDFANRGPVALARQTSFSSGNDQFDSIFEEHVAALLRARGWSVQTQVGVSKFRIDLGIVHPDFPGRFLAGVECDGASFHSSATARDRDRVRHSVLTELGWQLVRLWSTDFFLAADAAITRVHDALTELLKKDREEVARNAVPSTLGGDVFVIDEIDETSPDLGDDDHDDVAGESVAGPDISIQIVTPIPNTLLGDSSSVSLVQASDSSDTQLAASFDAADASLRAFAGKFYEENYLQSLRPLCIGLIDRAGPITFVHLAEQIARTHGFQRTGSEIKKRVWLAVGRNRAATKAPDGSVTFWPEGVQPVGHYDYRGSLIAGYDRPWQSTPYVEKLGLAVEIVRTCSTELRVQEMSRRVGFGRLRAKTRDELLELLESASAMIEQA